MNFLMINYTANYTTINVQKHRVGKVYRTRIPRIPTDLCDPVAKKHPFNPCQSVFKKNYPCSFLMHILCMAGIHNGNGFAVEGIGEIPFVSIGHVIAFPSRYCRFPPL